MSLWAYDPVTFVLIGEAFPEKIEDGVYREPDNTTDIDPLPENPGFASVFHPDRKLWQYDSLPVKQTRVQEIKAELVRLDVDSVLWMRRFIIKITAPGEAIELQDIDARAEVLRQELGDLEGARAKVRGA